MEDKTPGNPWTKRLLIWMAALFALVVAVQMIGGGRAAAGEPISYSQFVRSVDAGEVQGVTITTSSNGNATISGRYENGKTFLTVAPADARVSDRLIGKNVAVRVKEEEGSSLWLLLLYNSLPFLLILGISIFAMRQMQKGAGSGAMGFGKSRAKMLTEKQGRVTFADVAGIDEAREELQEIVEYLKDPGKFARL